MSTTAVTFEKLIVKIAKLLFIKNLKFSCRLPINENHKLVQLHTSCCTLFKRKTIKVGQNVLY